jgi:cytochrome c oxidase subunit 2
MLDLIGKYLPTNASAHGPNLDYMTNLVHWLMLILFVGWGAYFLFVLFRFRAGRNPQADHVGVKSHYSTYAEVGVAVVEAIILFAFAIPAWASWVTPHDAEAEVVNVRVVGEQFAWNIHYPGPDGMFGGGSLDLISPTNPLGLDPDDPMGQDDVTALNTLRLPVDRPATIFLSSKDVIHSFGLPVMRVKQDAIPGMEVPVHFTPIKTNGDEQWEIACAQLCGLGHYRMRGFLEILPQGEFDQWMADEVAKRMPQHRGRGRAGGDRRAGGGGGVAFIDYSSLATVNASLNGIGAVLLVAGFIAIRGGHQVIHRRLMKSAFACAVLFLVSYLIYHAKVGSVPFQGTGPIRKVYFAILISHTVLAAAVPFLAIITLWRALKERFPSHRAIARWTLPIWLYVSVTGVVIYRMVYHWS